MNVQLLIDDIVRQTTVLIAQLSTSTGLRAPLSHVADQVFRELARELDAQGVRRKVVADMFGMALRSYQMKVRRLDESPNFVVGSLWQRIYADLSQGTVTRAHLEKQYRTHTPKQIAATLQDMVQSGLVYSSGRGPDTIFGLTSDADRAQLSANDQERMQRDLGWYLVAGGAVKTRAELAAELRLDAPTTDAVVQDLTAEGHVTESDGRLHATRFEVAIGAERGWETSVMDHFRAMTTAIAAKVNRPVSAEDDEIGGGTRTFFVHPNHPDAPEVYALLSETRIRTRELWRRVTDYNAQTPPPENSDRVTFYFGQNVVRGATASDAEDQAEGHASSEA